MEAKSNVQLAVERQRSIYVGEGLPALLYQIAKCHHLSIREFAKIFDISKDYAANILHHRVFPTVDLAVKIARYFECTVEELFGWRVDDEGYRRPLLAVIPGTVKTVRLKTGEDAHKAVFLAKEALRLKREKIAEERR